MENLEKAIAYTKKKKTYQLKTSESHFEEPLDELNGYLNEVEHDSSVSLNLEYLSSWYLWQFLNNFVKKNELDYEVLAKSTYYAIESNNWKFAIGTVSITYDSATLFHYSTSHLGQLLYLGWTEKAKAYGNLLLKMLYGKQYTGGNAWAKHPWFIVQLFCRWQGITLDIDKLHYPKDMGVYQTALDNWNTTDSILLSKIIDQLSDFHIKQSDEDVTMDEYGGENGPEFTTSNYFIFPIEILTWLAIRKNLKLPEYNPLNDLMQMEINQLPKQNVPYPEDELVEQCKAKLLKDNPGLQFEM